MLSPGPSLSRSRKGFVPSDPGCKPPTNLPHEKAAFAANAMKRKAESAPEPEEVHSASRDDQSRCWHVQVERQPITIVLENANLEIVKAGKSYEVSS